jgi:hypothetical protein
MPRLKKKYMKKYAQPRPVVAPVRPGEATAHVLNMTLRDAATRYGVPVKSIRTLVKNYGIDVAQWKWKPRKPAEVIVDSPEQAHAETRAVEYAIAAGIRFTARADGAFMFLDLRGLICFPSSEERSLLGTRSPTFHW